LIPLPENIEAIKDMDLVKLIHLSHLFINFQETIEGLLKAITALFNSVMET
jgi:hypothetical protein